MPYANAKLTTHFCGSQNTHIYNMENRSTIHNFNICIAIVQGNLKKSTEKYRSYDVCARNIVYHVCLTQKKIGAQPDNEMLNQKP